MNADGLMGMDERATRQAFRQFVRAHHPDRGGDPEFFMAGLAELRGDRRGDVTTPEVRRPVTTAYKRQGVVRQLCGRIMTSILILTPARNRSEPQPPRVQ